jgi:hypothetical protein
MSTSNLRDLQEAFARAVLSDDAGEIAALLGPDGGVSGDRLAIYRRAVTANLVGALRAAYPVVVRLVGDAFFFEAAKRFARARPPECGDLNRFGSGFTAFLRNYGPAASLPWLSDVAKLEWACHEASLAADGDPLDLAALGCVPADRQGELRFDLHPSVRVVRSAWPVLAIWEANQTDRDGTPGREAGEDIVLVWREVGEVRAATLAPSEAAFIEALAAGSRLEDAIGAGDWDLPAFLVRIAGHGVLGPGRAEIPGGPSPISP